MSKVTKGRIAKGRKLYNVEKGQKLQNVEKGENYKKPEMVENYKKPKKVWEKSAEKFVHGESKRWRKYPWYFLLVNSGLGWFIYGNHP